MLRRLAIRLAVPAAVLAAGAAAVVPAATAQRVKSVEVSSNAYTPGKQTIRKGDKVRFRWAGGFDVHDVNVAKGPEEFSSPLLASGTWSHRFKKPGRYVLYCSQHEDMTMRLVVKKR